MKRLRLAIIISLILLMSIYAVNSSEAGTKKIKLNKKTITLNVGEKKAIKVKAKAKVKWKSSDTKIATVNKKGVVKANKEGSARITVSDKKNKNIRAVCSIKVEGINNNENIANIANIANVANNADNANNENIDNAAIPTQEPKNTPTPCMTGSIWVIFDHVEKIDDEWSYLYGKPKENVYKDTLIRDGIEMLKIKTKNSQIEKFNPVNGDLLIYIYSDGLKADREGNTLSYYGEGDNAYALMYNRGQTY